MLEVLIAVSILAFVGVAFMIAMTGAFQSQEINEEQVRAENLVRAQLEYIRYCAYYVPPTPLPYTLPSGGAACIPLTPSAYTVPPPGAYVPSGYSITVTMGEYCNPTCLDVADIQKNTVRVLRDAKTIVTVEDLKTRR